MPWQSKKQMRAAYGGYLGAEMKKKAPTWTAHTPSIKALPESKNSIRVAMKKKLKK